jgi:hypothetical protein
MIADEDVQQEAKEWLRKKAGKRGIGVTVELFHKYCNEELLPTILTDEELKAHLAKKQHKPGRELEIISIGTARDWLEKLGWRYKDHSKSTYYDGHEDPAVVTYRQDVWLKIYTFVLAFSRASDETEAKAIGSAEFMEEFKRLCESEQTRDAMVKCGLSNILAWQGEFSQCFELLTVGTGKC